jgi:RNA polymerase sigma-70 factor (ECF subfamily)
VNLDTVMTNAGELFTRYHRDILRYLAHMTGRPDEAEDLTQEVFVRAIRALKNGGTVGHERGWVFSIARNVLVDRHREEQRRIATTEIGEQISATPLLALDLRNSLARIPAPDREIFLLREVGGLTYLEISDACGISIEGVRARLYRTRIALRAMLEGKSPGHDRRN